MVGSTRVGGAGADAYAGSGGNMRLLCMCMWVGGAMCFVVLLLLFR